MSRTDKLEASPTNACYPVSYEIHKVVYQNSVSLNLAAGLTGLICGISTILIVFLLRKRIQSKVGGSKKENIEAWQWSRRRETLDKLELEIQYGTDQNQIQSSARLDPIRDQWLDMEKDIIQLREKLMIKLLSKFPNQISEEQLLMIMLHRLTYSAILASQEAKDQHDPIWNEHFTYLFLLQGIDDCAKDPALRGSSLIRQTIMKEAINVEYLVAEIAHSYMKDCREKSMIYGKRDSHGSTVAEIHLPNDDHRDEEYRIRLPTNFNNDLDAFIHKTYRIDPTNLGQLLDFSHSIQTTKRVEIFVKSIIAERHANFDLDSIAELLPWQDQGQSEHATIVDYGTAILRTVLLIHYQMFSNTTQRENQPSKCDHDMLSSLMKKWINFQRFFALHNRLYQEKKQ